MENDGHIVHDTAAELAAMRARGESRSDCSRVEAMTDANVEASIDLDDEGEFDWSNVQVVTPKENSN
jgi:hypothetical protein